MGDPIAVNQIVKFAAKYGWSCDDLIDARMKIEKMPVVPDGISTSKALRNSIIALVMALLGFGVTLCRAFGVW